ncbi:ATP-dependent zinc protease family protein [Ectothiorhodospira lacustris]|uniref:ATP-dependent zinc protease family protein n=1 Tax=Ectothiorhodospira lacustris TaxID=2899127 RepID=UPI001EE89120|nr:RimK/LysX family protein [Ectothiorhodospira lacustris]MCG5501451.1 RimK/LysX family protein [Ectothiorhodospira lacustris]MCG5509893.1 RimK/LysX family protein [Ectothiorhodospira lacustris]MCG5521146.1 RimK/LysX family protein [Ectothiorhodospira lacustris]
MSNQTDSPSTQPRLGWRERIALPELGLDSITCKVDTGARTCALHAFYVEPFTRDGQAWVRFGVHPLRRRRDMVVDCEAPVSDRRVVTDSGGHRQRRHVIHTPIVIGTRVHLVEITLTNRDTMSFRMLLGRNALQCATYLVDSTASWLAGEPRGRPA